MVSRRRGFLGRQAPPSASVRPRATASPSPSRRSRCRRAAGRARTSGPAPRAGCRAPVDDDDLDRVGGTCASTRTGCPGACLTASPTRLATTRSRSRHRWSPGERAHPPRGARRPARGGDRQRQHLVEAAGSQHRVDQPALQPRQVEQVVDEPLQLLGGSSTARVSSRRSSSEIPDACRPSTEARMVANGGRSRARSPEARRRGGFAALEARGALVALAVAAVSSSSPVWTANASSTRWSLASTVRRRARAGWLSSTRTGCALVGGGREWKAGRGDHGPAAGTCFSNETASWPNVSRSRSTIASAVSWPVSTLWTARSSSPPRLVRAGRRPRDGRPGRRRCDRGRYRHEHDQVPGRCGLGDRELADGGVKK